MGRLDDLERLQMLKESGTLTQEEFEQEKKKILNADIVKENVEHIEQEANNVCVNCGSAIFEGDKFCGTCGHALKNSIQEDIIEKNLVHKCINKNDSVLDEESYTIATTESIFSSSIKIIALTALWCGIGFISFSLPMMTTALGIGLAVLICSWFIRPLIGDCPYCKSKVKSYNKDGYVCPRCGKRVAVKDNKFLKIKE